MGRDHSKDIADYKAVIENVMHESEQITDPVYSSFQESEIKNQIASLGGNGGKDLDGDIERLAQPIVEKLQGVKKVNT